MNLYQELQYECGLTNTQTYEAIKVFKQYLDAKRAEDFIRSADGNNTMDAGQLAQKIVDYIIAPM